MLSKKLLPQICNNAKNSLRYYAVIAANINAASATFDATTNSSSDNTSGTNKKMKYKFKMAGWQIHSYGANDELQFSNKLRRPRIRSANECLVKIFSSTVNPIDVIMLGGYAASALNVLRDDIEFPLTLGREFCGEITQRGMNANPNLDVGERVWGVVPLHLNGCHAEYVAVPDYCLSTAPTILSNEEAASVLYAGLTAWSGLYVTGGLGGVCGAINATGGGVNKRILILGGSGSVGSTAIQMLKSQKAQVVATCSEDAMELVRNLGADEVIDYTNPIQFETLRSFAPYDIVLDCAGQGVNYAEKLKFNFHQYITFSSPLVKNFDDYGIGVGTIRNLTNLVEKNLKTLTEQGGTVKWGLFVPAPNGIQFLKQQVERKKLLPVIDSCYKFEQLPEAFEKVRCGHLRGKVVVNLD